MGGLSQGHLDRSAGRELQRETGDLLKITDSRVAPHTILLLDVFKFRGVDVHPSQDLSGKREPAPDTGARAGLMHKKAD